MSDPVYIFPSGKVVDFRPWPFKVLGADSCWRDANEDESGLKPARDAIRLKASDIARLDALTMTKSRRRNT